MVNEANETEGSFQSAHWLVKVTTVIAITLSIYQLYVSLFSKLGVMQERAIFLGFGLVLIFLIHPLKKSWQGTMKDWILNILFIVLSISSTIYIVLAFERIVVSYGVPNNWDYIFAVVTITLVFEASRRVVGIGLPIIALFSILYIFVGPHLPDLISHYGVTAQRFLTTIYMTTEGMYGSILGVVATYVFIFILFGAFLKQSGAGEFYIKFSIAIVGRLAGGPAYVATLASALMGMINGSGVANAASTGVFTIPLMKDAKFKSRFAAAVEALASSGGQIMPPVMGASAFIMVDFLGEPYYAIITAALIPALLYFISIFFMIYFETKKLNIQPVETEDIPKLSELVKDLHHFLPPVILVVLLAVFKLTPVYSAIITLGFIIVVSWFKKESRLTPRKILLSLEEAGRGSIMIIAAAALASIVIGVINLTGIGLELSSWIITLAGGSLILLLILTMISSLVLGMGLPTSATYIILAVLVAPALIDMGLTPIAAHLFVLYFGVLAIVTPPIGGAIFVTAGIAKSNVNMTGIIATKLGIAGFLVPFIFVRNNALIMMGTPLEISIAFITALIGIFSLAAGVQGYLIFKTNWIERILLIFGALLMIEPGLYTDIIGIIIFGLVLIYQFLKRKGRKTSKEDVHPKVI